MSRSFLSSRRGRAVGASAVVAALCACSDAPLGVPSGNAIARPFHQFEMSAARGDTLDLGPEMLTAGADEALACVTSDPSLILVADGAGTLVAAGSGDAFVSCVVTRQADPGAVVPIIEVGAASYRIRLFIR